MQHIELILGGARSGKSALAEQRALESGCELYYLATATADDTEMAARIAAHQERRDQRWHTVEEAISLAAALNEYCQPGRCIVVDCLTLWLSNCLHAQCWEQEREALLSVLPQLQGQVIFVSNETGLGVVPLGELSRRFVDEAGFLHQALGETCQRVILTVAGFPLALKPQGEQL
ncbi:MAG: bifunctional adenosylcobinamide kinase/adenosylcobinamide-phosphate guanylyltransferase [Pseudomonadota bacterium]